MKKKRALSILLASSVAVFPLLSLGGCASEKEVVLRIYNWEEYIDDGGKSGSYIYDEEHKNDPEDPSMIDDDFKAWYKETCGIELNTENTNSIVDDFELWYKKTYNTPVRVEYSTFGTNEELYNQLKLGNKYDLVCPSEYMIMKLAAEDMIEPLNLKEDCIYLKNVSPFIQNKFENGTVEVKGEVKHWSDYAAGYMWGTTGITYNPNSADEKYAKLESDLAEKGWSILIDETYKNKVTTKDNVRDSYFVGLGILYRDELLALDSDAPDYNEKVTEIMNRTDDESIEKVKKILFQMKENIFSFETDTGKSDMVKGTILMNFAWSGDAVYAMDVAEAEGAELCFYIPEECSNLFFDGWVMPKDDSRDDRTRDAARAFIDFLSMPYNAVRNMYYIGYTSVIAGDEMFDYADYTYGVYGEEDGKEGYDISYFFGEAEGSYVIYPEEDQFYRQLYAQYPPEEVMRHCAVMNYYGEEDEERINELWTKVKGETLDGWAIAVIVIAATGIVLGVLFVNFGGKIEWRRKPKKGYKLVEQKPLK